MIYTSLDTNIFVRIISQGKPGCEIEQFKTLKALVDSNTIDLLVPEVVILELDKQRRTFTAQFDASYEQLKSALTKPSVWTEMEDVRLSLLDELEERRKAKLQALTLNFDVILTWLNSGAVRRIPFSVDVWFAAKKRIMAGRYPKNQGKADQDCSIIESLISFFRQTDPSAAELYFCSENHADFACEEEAKDKSRVFKIHPDFRAGLPDTTHYFLTLNSLMAFAQGFDEFEGTYVTLGFPTHNTALQAGYVIPFGNTDPAATGSQGRYKIVDGLEPSPYTGVYDGVDVTPVLTIGSVASYRKFDQEKAEQFERTMMQSLSPAGVELRTSLTTAISELLAQCRECESWNNKSEYALPQ